MTHSTPPQQKRPSHTSLSKMQLVWVMLPVVTFYCFALDLYVPLIPTIQDFFSVNHSAIQATNSTFVLTIALGQLFFGPLSDHLGRRKVLFASILLFLFASSLCATATYFPLFILGRIVQGLGACGAYLTCFATVRDLFQHDEEATEMFSHLNVATSTSAIIAPSIGSFLSELLGWRSIFYALMLSSFLTTLYCAFLYPSTSKSTMNHKGLQLSTVFKNYYTIVQHPNYLLYTPPAAIGIASFFALYSISPFMYMEVFAFSKALYSVCYGSFGLAFFIGSSICSQVLKKLGILGTLLLGLSLHTLCVTILLLEASLANTHIWLMHTTCITMIFGASFMVSAGIGGTMQPFSHMAGAAFAMISCLKFLACFLIAEWVVAYFDDSFLSFALTFLILDCLALLGIFWKKDTQQPPVINAAVESSILQERIEDQIL